MRIGIVWVEEGLKSGTDELVVSPSREGRESRVGAQDLPFRIDEHHPDRSLLARGSELAVRLLDFRRIAMPVGHITRGDREPVDDMLGDRVLDSCRA